MEKVFLSLSTKAYDMEKIYMRKFFMSFSFSSIYVFLGDLRKVFFTTYPRIEMIYLVSMINFIFLILSFFIHFFGILHLYNRFRNNLLSVPQTIR